MYSKFSFSETLELVYIEKYLFLFLIQLFEKSAVVGKIGTGQVCERYCGRSERYRVVRLLRARAIGSDADFKRKRSVQGNLFYKML